MTRPRAATVLALVRRAGARAAASSRDAGYASAWWVGLGAGLVLLGVGADAVGRLTHHTDLVAVVALSAAAAGALEVLLALPGVCADHQHLVVVRSCSLTGHDGPRLARRAERVLRRAGLTAQEELVVRDLADVDTGTLRALVRSARELSAL